MKMEALAWHFGIISDSDSEVVFEVWKNVDKLSEAEMEENQSF